MIEPEDGASAQRGANPASKATVESERPEWAAQVVLAAIMRSPEKAPIRLIQERYPDRESRFYGDVIGMARNAISELIDGLNKATATEPTPILLDRLSFTWKILRQADALVRKPRKKDMPQATDLSHVRTAFASILPEPFKEIQPPLLDALVDWLRLGPDGRYLYHYWYFRKANSPTRLPEPFSSLAKTKDAELLRTVIWWCLRARNEKFIEVADNEPVRIAYEFVVEEILKDLKGWCGSDIEGYPGVAAEVESELDRWLRYSHLDLSANEAAFENDTIDPVFAKAFVKYNGLDVKLRIQRSPSSSLADEHVRQLETTIQQYADEIRALEDRIRTLQSSPLPSATIDSKSAPSAPAVETPQSAAPSPAVEASQSEPDITGFTELREVLKTIDSKYAFDTLNAVQLGEETHLTFRSFAAHLLYALRKRGFSEYPKEEVFTLSYEASGLYECEGFEVPAGSSVPVKVTRKGWALKARGRWLPVRRARVSCTSAD